MHGPSRYGRSASPATGPHPFLSVSRITLSPHIGGVAADAYVNIGVPAVRNALSVLSNATAIR